LASDRRPMRFRIAGGQTETMKRYRNRLSGRERRVVPQIGTRQVKNGLTLTLFSLLNSLTLNFTAGIN
jgi:hypothetical protein